MQNGANDDLANVVDAYVWDELDAFSKEDMKMFLRKPINCTYEANRDMLDKGSFQKFEKAEPENASQYRAEQLADMMIRFAKLALENKQATKK